jgi:hypothetical protein
MWAEKPTDDNCCFTQVMKLIVMCSKLLNHPSDKLGYCGITLHPLRVTRTFKLKIGMVKCLAFQEPHIRDCAMRDERSRDWTCGIVFVQRRVSHMSVTASISLKSECNRRILDRPSSIPGLWIEQKRETKYIYVGNGFQVVSPSVKLAKFRLPYTYPHGLFHTTLNYKTNPVQKWTHCHYINYIFQPKYH